MLAQSGLCPYQQQWLLATRVSRIGRVLYRLFPTQPGIGPVVQSCLQDSFALRHACIIACDNIGLTPEPCICLPYVRSGAMTLTMTLTMTMNLHLSQPARLIRRLKPTWIQQDLWPTISTSNI